MFREIWTTTPWTLPLNNAICFSSESQYVAVSFKDSLKAPITEVYLIAEPLVSSVTEITGRALAVISHFKGKSLLGKQYKSCWHPELALPMLAADHVSMFKGTGLVHTSFAHGFIDYNIAVSDNYKVESFVDENGCYTRHMGPSLENKEVLTAGQQEVLRNSFCSTSAQKPVAYLSSPYAKVSAIICYIANVLSMPALTYFGIFSDLLILKKDVVHKWKYRHSYPYDWRTNKPVIIRSSAQWFFDVSSMSKRAAQLARSIQIGNDESVAVVRRNRIASIEPIRLAIRTYYP
ncbi:hypothetical protein DICVIV_13468 [Dictyocaulus viviparus]|uniref:Uncharacterized protein n=1 Tax=Dictyocaulus viviparus TaxID=29172 RepID=A0A0D8XDQ2_DICVI|nr:hypothetical protein DICVIV_13468 [Dictyocaulus viviparus]